MQWLRDLGARLAQIFDAAPPRGIMRWLISLQFALGVSSAFMSNKYIGICMGAVTFISAMIVNEVNGRGWGQQGWLGVGKFIYTILAFPAIVLFLYWVLITYYVR